MMIRFSERTANVIKNAYEISRKNHVEYIGTEHLLYGIFLEESNKAYELLKQEGLTLDALINGLEQVSGKELDETAKIDDIQDINQVVNFFTPRTRRVLEIAALAAKNVALDVIEPEHLLIAIIRENENVAVKLMSASGMDVKKIYAELMKFSEEDIAGNEPQFPSSDPEIDEINENLRDLADDGQGQPGSQGHTSKRDGKERTKTPNLDKYGRDLTLAAQKGEIDPIIGREQ
jgi:ATP-dependent Clp protease ATP-binding subunit ClpC